MMSYLYKIAAGACLINVGVHLERDDFGMAALGLCLAVFAIFWAYVMKGGE
jgi:hypothetical protein